MQNIIVGNLAGLEETKIAIDQKGEMKVYPRQDLEISLDWVFDHMGKRVICTLENGVVTEVRSLA